MLCFVVVVVVVFLHCLAYTCEQLHGDIAIIILFIYYACNQA